MIVAPLSQSMVRDRTGPLDLTKYSYKDLDEIASKGLVTRNGFHVSVSMGAPARPTEGSDVTIHVNTAEAIFENRPFEEGKDYKKTRLSEAEGPIYDQAALPFKDILSVGLSRDKPVTEEFRDSNGEFAVAEYAHLPPKRAKSMAKWKKLFADLGYVSRECGFGLKFVQSLLPNLRFRIGSQADQNATTLAAARVIELFDVARALEAAPEYDFRNLARPKVYAKELVDDDILGTISGVSNFIRVECEDKNKHARPHQEYIDLGLTDRQGNPLYDPVTGTFKRIETGTKYNAQLREAHKRLEWLWNGLENHLGQGTACLIEIIEPGSTKSESYENPKWDDPLTPEEAKHNILSSPHRWKQKFVNRRIGEIKSATASLSLWGSDRPFTVHVWWWDYQNLDQSTWGHIEPNEYGFVPQRYAPEEGDGPVHLDRTDCPFIEGQSILKYIQETLGTEIGYQTSLRDIRDRTVSEFLEEPRIKNKYGDCRCSMYSILPYVTAEKMLFEHFGEWMIRQVNHSIKINKGRTPITGPRYQYKKFDWQPVLLAAHLYGYDAPTTDPSHRTRLIIPIRLIDLDIKEGRSFLEDFVVRVPMDWMWDEEMRDLIPGWKGEKQIEFKFHMDEDGMWNVNYRSPMDEFILARREEAEKGYVGFRDDEKGIWIRVTPRVYDADRRLYHLAEWILRDMEEVNQLTYIRDEGYDVKDSMYFQGWVKFAYNIQGKITEISTVGFETGQYWILIKVEGEPNVLLPARPHAQKEERALVNAVLSVNTEGDLDNLLQEAFNVTNLDNKNREHYLRELIVRVSDLEGRAGVDHVAVFEAGAKIGQLIRKYKEINRLAG